MKVPRIYTADEARALRETLERGEGPAHMSIDIVASVEHHAARADAAEAALAAAHARIADLERLAAGPRTPAVDDGQEPARCPYCSDCVCNRGVSR